METSKPDNKVQTMSTHHRGEVGRGRGGNESVVNPLLYLKLTGHSRRTDFRCHVHFPLLPAHQPHRLRFFLLPKLPPTSGLAQMHSFPGALLLHLSLGSSSPLLRCSTPASLPRSTPSPTMRSPGEPSALFVSLAVRPALAHLIENVL